MWIWLLPWYTFICSDFMIEVYGWGSSRAIELLTRQHWVQKLPFSELHKKQKLMISGWKGKKSGCGWMWGCSSLWIFICINIGVDAKKVFVSSGHSVCWFPVKFYCYRHVFPEYRIQRPKRKRMFYYDIDSAKVSIVFSLKLSGIEKARNYLFSRSDQDLTGDMDVWWKRFMDFDDVKMN